MSDSQRHFTKKIHIFFCTDDYDKLTVSMLAKNVSANNFCIKNTHMTKRSITNQRKKTRL